MKWMSFALFACCLTYMAEPETQPVKIELGIVMEYGGNLDGLPIGMTLHFAPKAVSGTYFYHKYCKDIPITGTIEGRAISIQEFDGDKATARFVERVCSARSAI